MRFASFHIADQPLYGTVTDGAVSSVSDEFRARFPDLKSVIAGCAMDAAADSTESGTRFGVEDVRFDPVIPKPDKILCVGMNYWAHIKEMGREPPRYPAIFVRFVDSVVGHRQSVLRPAASREFDFEGELAVIIGRKARYVSMSEALEYVAGFSCFLDGSIRDYQMHTSQFTAGKNFPQSGAFGPWMLARDQMPDLTTVNLETRVSGQVMQQGRIDDLRFGIEALIEYASTICQLEPGDVIVTGTPSGVGMGREPKRWLEPGDLVQVEIDGIGVLENTVIDEK